MGIWPNPQSVKRPYQGHTYPTTPIQRASLMTIRRGIVKLHAQNPLLNTGCFDTSQFIRLIKSFAQMACRTRSACIKLQFVSKRLVSKSTDTTFTYLLIRPGIIPSRPNKIFPHDLIKHCMSYLSGIVQSSVSLDGVNVCSFSIWVTMLGFPKEALLRKSFHCEEINWSKDYQRVTPFALKIPS